MDGIFSINWIKEKALNIIGADIIGAENINVSLVKNGTIKITVTCYDRDKFKEFKNFIKKINL